MSDTGIEIDEKKVKKLEKAIIRHENEVIKKNSSEDVSAWIVKKIKEVVSCN